MLKKVVNVCLASVFIATALGYSSVASAATTKVFSDQGVGGGQSLLLQQNGTVWSVGDNSAGQLGDGTKVTRSVTKPVLGLNDVVQVSSGVLFSLALKEDGTVWAWGTNTQGQLGDGTKTQRLTPVKVKNLEGVVAISAGNGQGIALKSDGTVWAWGNNGSGELGDGTTVSRNTPVQVKNLTNVKAITAGNYHSVALKDDGTVWTWGSNIKGQLGVGTTGMNTNTSIPVKVSNLSNISSIKAGIMHTIALKVDGTIWSWGENGMGQIGDNTKTTRLSPVKNTYLKDVKEIGASGYNSYALTQEGVVWSWGNNGVGQLGIGTATSDVLSKFNITGVSPLGESKVPVRVIDDVLTMSTKMQHTFVKRVDGTIWAWGKNEFGQLGDGTTIFRLTPIPVFNEIENWDY